MHDANSAANAGTPAAASAAAPASTPVAAPVSPPTGVQLTIRTWNEVDQPGSYVCNDTGRLLRVPASALGNGNRPAIDYLGPQGPARVTRLSENPNLPVADLRVLATGASVKPQF